MQITLREYAYDTITDFIRKQVASSGANGIVLGLSGGIDSALTMKLCCDSVGSGKVTGLILPDRPEKSKDEVDASEYAESLGVRFHRYVISSPVSAVMEVFGSGNVRIAGNVKARMRMIFLYAYANSRNLLVAGTGNKSELLTGYFTKYGDGGTDMLPIGDLYKTEVRKLAERLSVPEVFLRKKPTAGLWEGQTDEGEMGLTYEELDSVLFCMENGFDPQGTVRETGLEREVVDRVFAMVRASAHKRRPPPIPKIGIRTVGADWIE